MTLYRYLNQQYALEALQTMQLKVGRLSELNDPADCRPRLINGPNDNDPHFEERYFAEIGQEIGVLCLSETYKDPVIWSHYADAHRGLALGYDFRADPGGAVCHPVHYELPRPVIDYTESERLRADDHSNRLFFDMVIEKGFCSKAPSWGYEKERRVFIQLGPHNCTMKGSHYFVRHMGPAPEQVIIGARCTLTVSDVRRAINSNGVVPAMTQIFKARLHSEINQIEI